MRIHRLTMSEKIAHVFLSLAAAGCVIPFLLLAISSLTHEDTLLREGYSFFPSRLSLEAYSYLYNKSAMIVRAYGITVLTTVVGTSVSLMITSLLAYALARSDLPGVRILSFLVVFTILFNGGLVPTYFVYARMLQIKNTLWALIIPRLLMTGFNVLLMRSFFKVSIPPAVLESARMDGAGEFYIFFNIVLPLSLPVMATIGLLSGLAYWNDWFNGLIYLTDPKTFSLQVELNQILMNIQYLANAADLGGRAVIMDIPSTAARMAIAVIGVLPVLIVYPFFQRYFIKGITLGAVKE